ncbi:MAG TPA: hypothetical protein PLV45_18575, partial [bacterium]|nr:hypothetical protein [bacterium]
HFTSTIMTILVIVLWMALIRRPDPVTAWAAGLASGMLVISRWQAAVLFLAFVVPVLTVLAEPETRWRRIRDLVIGAVAAGLVAAVQLTAWKLQLGHWICMPQGSGFVDFASPVIGRFLISGYHGLIPYAPGLLIGWIGLWLKPPAGTSPAFRRLLPGLAVVMLIQVYVSASVWDWWGGAAYGPRRMTFMLTPAAIGWAMIMRRLPGWLRAGLPVVMIAWGMVTLSAYRVHLDDVTMLITGTPDPFRPGSDPVRSDEAVTRWERWNDGFSKMRKPGFTMFNRPRAPHRRAGLGILAALAALAALLIFCLDRSRSVRIVVCLCVTGYVLGVVIYLNTGIPPNTPWKDHWYAVAKHQPEPPLPPVPVPAEYDLAVKLMKTVHQLQSSSGRGIMVPDRTYYEGFPGITLQELSETFSNRPL